jgi:hypothetical protein
VISAGSTRVGVVLVARDVCRVDGRVAENAIKERRGCCTRLA